MYHMKQFFKKLLENQLVVNRSKCSIGWREVDYLGHIICLKGGLS